MGVPAEARHALLVFGAIRQSRSSSIIRDCICESVHLEGGLPALAGTMLSPLLELGDRESNLFSNRSPL